MKTFLAIQRRPVVQHHVLANPEDVALFMLGRNFKDYVISCREACYVNEVFSYLDQLVKFTAYDYDSVLATCKEAL